ncbi:TonB-dependent receptor [Allopontixanthobacter sp.]|uniref:TonB-dependent receptor n=1 Tax=Allopontixanthobacter sp. TaxID=2906452 RepID=UPI002ABA829C|nr:TonB-dependent receptor [Allopontixanthobacter sp.]MDZ4308200.1 TonB-dependent receptor [Allopontixanthobacter sp.]
MKFNVFGRAQAARAAMLAGVASVAFIAPTAVMAQDAAPAQDEEPEEAELAASGNLIIVTASKREQTLQDTPIAVSVTTGETLERAQIRDLIDLQTVAPSLRVSQLQNAASTTFIIRGFGNGANNFGIEPSVGVFIDNVFRSRSAGQIADLANVSRIEVLNGPQSTLFGKNASAGVISVVTQEPQFEFGGSVSATYGNYDQIVLKGDITGPLTDSLAFAVDANYNKRDGYATVVNLDERINDRNRYGVRGQLLFDNGGALRVRAIADYNKIDEVCCNVGNVRFGPTAPAIFGVGGQIGNEDALTDRSFLNRLPTNEIESYGGSIQGDLELGALTLTSITAYRELTNVSNQDVDFTSADIVNEFRDQSVETFTQEFRLTSDFDGPLNFLLGGFYFDEAIDQNSTLTTGANGRQFFNLLAGGALAAVEAPLGLPAGSIFSAGPLTAEQFTLDNTSWSIFGTVDFEVTDWLTLTGGFNYTDDEKDFTLAQQSFDELSNISLVDRYIFLLTGGAVTTPAQFNALPAPNQGFLRAASTTQCSATSPAPPACNPFLGLTALQFQPPFLGLPNSVEPGQTRDDDFSYTLRASAELTDQINAYFTYATGFKASSVNLSRDSRPSAADFTPALLSNGAPSGSVILAPSSPIRDAGLIVPNLSTGSRFAGPEEAEVYEIGIKASFPGLAVNLAVFDQTIDGFQSFAFTGTGFALANAGSQSTRGFELDTTITPIPALVFTFATTYLDANYDSFTGSAVGDLSGTRPAGIPEWTIATSATYTHQLGSSGNNLIARVDYYHESQTQILDGLPDFIDRTQPDPFASARAAATEFRRETSEVNASLTLAMDMGLELSAYVRNLTDHRNLTTVFPGVAQSQTVSGYPNQPRTYGGTVRFKF